MTDLIERLSRLSVLLRHKGIDASAVKAAMREIIELRPRTPTMTTRPPLIPVVIEALAEEFDPFLRHVKTDPLWNKAKSYRYAAAYRKAREFIDKHIEPHLEACRLQARREALEEAATIAENFVQPLDVQKLISRARAIAQAIRNRTRRGES